MTAAYISEKQDTSLKPRISFDKLFWVFVIGCISGVIVEGLFCLIQKGHWESHVVSVWGWFNLLYGAGAVGFYVGAAKMCKKPIWLQVFIMTMTATLIELICGMILKYGIGMKAWDYSNQFLNLDGLICPSFMLVWAAMALTVCILFRFFDSFLARLEQRKIHIFAVLFSIILCLNFIMTAFSIVRWSERHYGLPNCSLIDTILDTAADDNWMGERFIEWRFIDE